MGEVTMTAEQIAAGLTKAQREYVLSADRTPDFSGGAANANWSDGDEMWDEMARLGVCEYWTDALTPLGLEVRRILQETTDD